MGSAGASEAGGGLAIWVTRETLSLLSEGVTSVGGSTGVTRFSSQGLWGLGPPSGDVEGLATGTFASFRDVGEMPASSSVKKERKKRVMYSGQPQDHYGDHQTDLRSSSKSALVKLTGVGFLTPSPW